MTISSIPSGVTISQIQDAIKSNAKKACSESVTLRVIQEITAMIAAIDIVNFTIDVTDIAKIHIAAYNPSNSDSTFTVKLDGVSKGTVGVGNAARGYGSVDISADTGEKILLVELTSLADTKLMNNVSIWATES